MSEETTNRKALGRGLDALFGNTPQQSQTANTQTQTGSNHLASGDHLVKKQKMLPVEQLRPSDAQPRRFFDDDALAQLSSSIKEHGILQPILVRPVLGEADTYEIIAGERRWRASQKAQLHEVPVIIQDFTDLEALEIALVENLQRQDLTPVEEADGYKKLMDQFGHTQEKLAQALGKSRSYIANTLRLLHLPESVRTMVHEGKLTAGHAKTLLGSENPENLAKQVIKSNMSVRDLEKLVRSQKQPEKSQKNDKVEFTKKPSKDSNILFLEKDLTNRLGLKVEVQNKTDQAGSLVIHYNSLDQLDEVLERLTHSKTL